MTDDFEKKWTKAEHIVAQALFEHMSMVYDFQISWENISHNRRVLYLQQARAAIKAMDSWTDPNSESTRSAKEWWSLLRQRDNYIVEKDMWPDFVEWIRTHKD